MRLAGDGCSFFSTASEFLGDIARLKNKRLLVMLADILDFNEYFDRDDGYHRHVIHLCVQASPVYVFVKIFSPVNDKIMVGYVKSMFFFSTVKHNNSQ